MTRPAPAGRRTPAVAGTFYPATADELGRVVDDELARAAERSRSSPPPEQPARRPKAIIAPHAGYVYSGPVAASAYDRLVDLDPPVRRVILLGPAHRVALFGMAVPTVAEFVTPLGAIPIDDSLRQIALTNPAVMADDRPHADEHSLEVHLPFLQRVLGADWSLLPVVVGDVGPGEVAEVLDRCWGGPETLVLASSDLSHYLDHDTAQTTDRETARLIVEQSVGDVTPRRACGARAVAGLLESARHHNLRVDLLDLRTSGDTAGSKDRVVGYGAFSMS